MADRLARRPEPKIIPVQLIQVLISADIRISFLLRRLNHTPPSSWHDPGRHHHCRHGNSAQPSPNQPSFMNHSYLSSLPVPVCYRAEEMPFPHCSCAGHPSASADILPPGDRVLSSRAIPCSLRAPCAAQRHISSARGCAIEQGGMPFPTARAPGTRQPLLTFFLWVTVCIKST